MDEETRTLWTETNSEEEIYEMNSAVEVIDEIIALYATRIAEEKRKKDTDENILSSLQTDLDRFQKERNLVHDAKVIKKILTLYAPSLEKMIVQGVI